MTAEGAAYAASQEATVKVQWIAYEIAMHVSGGRDTPRTLIEEFRDARARANVATQTYRDAIAAASGVGSETGDDQVEGGSTIPALM